jgi:membrane protease YdiL (CAAX protease family)
MTTIEKTPYKEQLSPRSYNWQKSNWAQLLVILLVVVPAYLLPVYFNYSDHGGNFDPSSALFYTIAWGGSMSILMLLVLRVVTGETIKDLNLKKGTWWKDILMGIGLVAATLGLFILTRNTIYNLLPSRPGLGNDLLFEELINNPRFFLIMTGPGLILGAGIYEELTRILLLSRLWKIVDKQIWRWGVVIFSAVVFGLMHMYQGPAGILSTGLSGLIMAVFYLRFGRILPMMIAHYLHDALQFIAAYAMFH